MSDHGQEDPRGTDHEYAVFVRPYVRIGISADTGTHGLEALSVAIDYDESGIDASGASDATTGDRRGTKRRDLALELYRHDRRVLSTEGGLDLDISEALGYVDDIAIALGDLSRRLR